MSSFEPHYAHLVDAARNIRPQRLPQYDHKIDTSVLEKILGTPLSHLEQSRSLDDRRGFAKKYAEGLRELGYDVVIFEACLTHIVTGGQSLRGLTPGPIQTQADFDTCDWNGLHDRYFSRFDESFSLLCETMPPGMKAAGGVGNGVFEILQDFVRYTELCMMMFEQPELFSALVERIGDLLVEVWTTFMRKYGEYFCVLRFGDDLGFKTNTLISDDHIREHIVPQYKRIVDLVHSHDKPFLLHCCGNIFSVMDDLIDTAGIDAKHSNEDQIAEFGVWVEKYGKRIGNFGGIDMNIIVSGTQEDVKKHTRIAIDSAIDAGGFACGSGNSIPDYVPANNYRAMLDAIGEYRRPAG